jgi:hypothetical protein
MKRTVHIACSLFTSALLGLGCSGSGFDDGNGDNLDEGGKGTPKAGQFFTVGLPSADDACFGLSLTVLSLTSDVKVAEDGKSYTYEDSLIGSVDEDEGTLVPAKVSCAANAAGGFDCTTEIAPAEIGEGAVEKIDAKLTVKWLSDDRIEGEIEVSLSCEGDGCATYEACTTKAKYIGLRAMPENFVPEVGTYDASIGKPLLNTCATAPANVPEQASLRIEPQEGGTANVYMGEDATPFLCAFEGKGRTTCDRMTVTNNVESFGWVDATWTSASSFEGVAIVDLVCAEGADCSASGLAEPCLAVYQIKGVGGSKGAAE